MQNQPVDPSLLPMYERLTTALDAFALGDAEPYKALWAHTEDVSVLGAFGGRNLGWSEVGPRLDFAASQYRTVATTTWRFSLRVLAPTWPTSSGSKRSPPPRPQVTP